MTNDILGLGLDLGSFFQGLTALFSAGVLAVVATFYVRNRQVSINAEQVLRTHFGEELKRLSDELDRSVARQLQCEAREEALRKRVRHLEQLDAERTREITDLRLQISKFLTQKERSE